MKRLNWTTAIPIDDGDSNGHLYRAESKAHPGREYEIGDTTQGLVLLVGTLSEDLFGHDYSGPTVCDLKALANHLDTLPDEEVLRQNAIQKEEVR